MRVVPVAPGDLAPEQRPLYEDMRHGIESSFRGFKAIGEGGALIGPWAPWLKYAKYGAPIWDLVKALSFSPSLPRTVREVAILVVGTHFHCGYELYAHVILAEARGLTDPKVATIVAGQRPTDLGSEETLAYDMASALVAGGILPEIVYRQAVATFGEDGTAELIHLVGLYALIAVILNGFNVPVPDDN